MLNLGIKISPEQYPPGDMLEHAIAAEEAGFDSLNVSDHFHPWDESGQCSFTWTWLGAAAARLKRMSMGTGVTCPILRYNPAIIAQAMATLDNMSAGRVYLGVGTGEALNEYPVTAEWPDYNERRDMMLEAMELIRALWTGAEVTFEGQYYTTQKAKLYTAPARDIPIYVSSLVPESAYFSGMYGDGLITAGGYSPGTYREMIGNFDSGARVAGKEPSLMPHHIEYSVGYTDNVEAVVEEIRQYWAGTAIHAMYLQKIYTPKMSAENGAVVGKDTIRKKTLITSDPEQHAKLAQRYIDLGFRELYVHIAGPDHIEAVRRYAREVLPIIRQRNERLIATPSA